MEYYRLYRTSLCTLQFSIEMYIMLLNYTEHSTEYCIDNRSNKLYRYVRINPIEYSKTNCTDYSIKMI